MHNNIPVLGRKYPGICILILNVATLKVSLQGRISTVKMNLLPRFNFFFSMLPLSPPPGYFKEINSIISKFIWNDKCPRIKLTTLQHPNSAGGLAVPNFELYYWSFQLKALHNWVDPQSTVSWRVIEADKVKPNRLQDILFTGTGKKGDNYKFGPVVANSIKIWKTVERRIGGPFKFCNSTPLWHNFNFVCGNRPFVQPSWSSLGVNTCGDMYDNQGLCSFQALRAKFCLPASAYFVFLQLRSALKAYGVPWASSISSHPMRDWIAPSAGRPSVSLIYKKIIDCITKPLSIKTIWNRELSDLNLSVVWERVWSNLSLTSASERRLVVPSQRGSKSLSRTFSFTIPGWWNNLPTPIRNAGSLSIFKQQLKTHLFRHYLTSS